MNFGYRAQLPAAVAQRLALSDGGIGSAVGAGIARAGELAVNIQFEQNETAELERNAEQEMFERKRQRERSIAIATGRAAFAEWETSLAQEIETRRAATDPGAPGYGDAAEELVRNSANEFVNGLPDDMVVREYFLPLMANAVQRSVTTERAFERERRVTYQGELVEQSVNADTAALARSSDQELFSERLTAALTAIDLMEDLDGTTRAVLKQNVTTQYSTAFLDGLLERREFDRAEQLIESGTFDPLIGMDTQTYRDRIANGREIVQREEEAARNAAQQEAVEALDVISILMERGEYRGSYEDIQAALGAAQAAGVEESVLLEYAFLLEDHANVQSVQNMNPAQLQAEAEALRARIESGEATPADRRRYDLLQGELGYRDQEAGANLSELNDQGPQGQAQATAELAAMPLDRRWAAARESGNARLAVYAQLPGRLSATAIEGATLREARPDDFLPAGNGSRGSGGRAAAEAIFRSIIGEDQVDALGSRYPAYVDAALDLAAGTARRWDEPAFRRAVAQVFGASARADGTWQGGPANLSQIVSGMPRPQEYFVPGRNGERGRMVRPERLRDEEFSSSTIILPENW
ncbi:MAG: hypothetical protein VKL39_17595, partial [Leptolyngbyaceae bacterium]|nr:hypothetical protein [Leptolyngbyaceae bacterium]